MNTFNSYDELIAYTEKLNRFTPGERVKAGDDIYEYMIGWRKVECPTISLYEINQQLMSKASIHNDKELEKDVALINKWYFDDPDYNDNYMLLNHENHYYTVFSLNNDDGIDSLGQLVIDTLLYIGDIISVETKKDEIAIEIWVKLKDGPHVFYLFGYDQGVITFRG